MDLNRKNSSLNRDFSSVKFSPKFKKQYSLEVNKALLAKNRVENIPIIGEIKDYWRDKRWLRRLAFFWFFIPILDLILFR
jgi:hypothetical protein